MERHAEELKQAVRRWSDDALRRESGHPSLATLEEYVAGEAAAPEGLRDHLAACADCAALALDLAAFPAIEPAAGVAPLSAEELEAVWRGLAPGAPAARRAAGPRGERRRRWASGPQLPWALAASFAGLFVVTGLWGLQQLRAKRDLAAPRLTNLAEVDLMPADAALRGGERAASGAAPTGRSLLLRLNAGRRLDDGPFELVITRTGREVVETVGGLDQDEDTIFSLVLPPGLLRPGTYELRLRRQGDPDRATIERFELTIPRE